MNRWAEDIKPVIEKWAIDFSEALGNFSKKIVAIDKNGRESSGVRINMTGKENNSRMQ